VFEIDDWQAARRQIAEAVKHSAYHIIDYKGATGSPSPALTRIAAAHPAQPSMAAHRHPCWKGNTA